MYNLMRSEWTKLVRNYKLTSFLVWIYPVGVGAFFGFMLVLSLVLGDLAEGLAPGPGDWRQDFQTAWGVITAFPLNVFGRMLPLAFMAVVFAGEYEWGTLKNVVPRIRRPQLVVAKLVTLTAMIMLSLTLTTLLVGIGSGLTHVLSGQTWGPALSGSVLADFSANYGREAGLALVSVLILGAVAAIAAILSRSILGALLIGFGFSMLDLIAIGILMAVSFVLKRPELMNLMRFTPNYNLENVRSWLVNGAAAQGFGPQISVEPSLSFSLVWLGLWLLGLIGLALWLFQRQDITS